MDMDKVALVVDDSMLIRHTVCRYLEERGFDVESATNGLDALEILKKVRPDIIVTDLQMPKMDGCQFIDALKSRPETAGIPIVILAAKNRRISQNDVEKLANFVISKDIDIVDQLQRALEAALPSSSKQH
jgi:CheY-like chemotaxis protein